MARWKWSGERGGLVGLLGLFASSFLVGFSGAMMPGPLTAAAITQSAWRGFWAAPLLVCGHSLAELAMVLALALGLGSLFRRNLVSGLIGLVGGLVLIWMGLDIIRSVWQGRISLSATGAQASSGGGLSPLVTGILVSIANPYWVLWWATIGLSYVMLSSRRGSLGVGAFYTGHILSDLIWLSFIALAMVSGRRVLGDSIYRGILAGAGCALVVLSLYFIYSGLNFLRAKSQAPWPGQAS